LIFGCKDLRFCEAKAGLYFWRRRDRRLFQLRRDQICSNGKKVLAHDDGLTLLDIDSPRKTVTAYPFDPDAGTLGEGRIALDLRDGEAFPDGMILTPEAGSVIISFYDPRDVAWGETRQYRLADGVVETVWRTPLSPRATCPLLLGTGGAMKLVITTAVEHMPPEQQARHANAGCLFVAETS
jgi:sugar lactone lactonase YvrE